MNRSAAREEAFKFLYSLEIQKENLPEQIQLYFESENIVDKQIQQYIQKTISGIEANKETIEEKIEKNLKKDWKLDRLSKIDVALLKIAIYEILYTDIPYKVAINEVVEIAKKYGADNSSNFVNGILASVVKERENL